MPILTNQQLTDEVDDLKDELGPTPEGVYANVRVRLDILESRINNPATPGPNVENPFIIGNSGITISTGTGEPTEDRVPGSLYLRQDSEVNNSIYFRNASQWYSINSSIITVSSLITNNYVVLNTDYIVAVGTLSSIINIDLPTDPEIGRNYIIKDVNGSASTYDITVSGNGNNIDGASTVILNSDYSSLKLVFTGLQWSII